MVHLKFIPERKTFGRGKVTPLGKYMIHEREKVNIEMLVKGFHRDRRTNRIEIGEERERGNQSDKLPKTNKSGNSFKGFFLNPLTSYFSV